MAIVKPPTPTEFEERMKEIKEEYFNKKLDQENCHAEMDAYILDVLESIGYYEGVRVFRTTPKWYA